jgi:hypothetical protein
MTGDGKNSKLQVPNSKKITKSYSISKSLFATKAPSHQDSQRIFVMVFIL